MIRKLFDHSWIIWLDAVLMMGTQMIRKAFDHGWMNLLDDVQAKQILQELRDSTRGGDYILQQFTYADIAVACMAKGMRDRS